MKREKITELVEYLTNLELEINMTKGREYAGDDDALSNFKLAAEIVGISPLQVCLVYTFKTFMAMGSYAKHNKELSDESIEGRVLDLRLYGALFLALAKEQGCDWAETIQDFYPTPTQCQAPAEWKVYERNVTAVQYVCHEHLGKMIASHIELLMPLHLDDKACGYGQPVPINLAEELKSRGKPIPIDLAERLNEVEGKTDG